MQSIARQRGGKCLSKVYVNTHRKLQWECAEGHKWSAVPSSIKRGSWCPYCAKKKNGITQKLNIKEMQQIAGKRGGRCLSNTYINANTKLKWKCAKGHQWEATPNSIKRVSWCPYCAGKAKLTIEGMRRLAEVRGGRCLSSIYKNINTKLLWKCKDGHTWETAPSNVVSGNWCPYCGGSLRLNIGDVRKMAEERGGKCLSNEYVNAHRKLWWKCKHNHRWEASSATIKRGSWCPICASGLGERICKECFEQLFGKEFPKSYPIWLVNSCGNQMELDGYCHSLGLAFEHQGQQHFNRISFFQKTEKEFRNRLTDDVLKKQLCKEHGVTLIEIPELSTMLPIDELRTFITTECVFKKITLPRDFKTKPLDFKRAYTASGTEEALRELKTIAQERGGKCLSDDYVNNQTKLLWECAEGHKWEAAPGNIKFGTWCPYCGGSLQLTIEEMQQIAKERGGKCLTDIYVNARTKLFWECSEGHQWKAVSNSIKSGTWCPYCAKKVRGDALRHDIKEMQHVAKERGGKCLSYTYVGANTKLLWECSKGHQWEATPGNIKFGKWCPYCSGNMKLTIEEMQLIALERGGKCLSNAYINNKAKLRWECSEGHRWEANSDHIKRGQWCSKCYKLK
jgi:hypothetical protein